MNDLRTAAQQALEALERYRQMMFAEAGCRWGDGDAAITALRAALASSCDEQRHELWESGGVAGCERARVAERQRDALLAEHQQTLAHQQRSYEREIQLEVEAERERCLRLIDEHVRAVDAEDVVRAIREVKE